MRAARIVWFLQLFGHPDARMLDGGVRRWRAEGGALVRVAGPEWELPLEIRLYRASARLRPSAAALWAHAVGHSALAAGGGG